LADDDAAGLVFVLVASTLAAAAPSVTRIMAIYP
jgi:hypothetical protein